MSQIIWFHFWNDVVFYIAVFLGRHELKFEAVFCLNTVRGPLNHFMLC